MNKELEALEEMYNWIYCNAGTTYEDDVKLDKIRKIVGQALLELKAIKETKSSEALECLKSLDIQVRFLGILDIPSWEKYLPTIKQYILKAQEQEKELAKWEVVKKKKVDLRYLEACLDTEYGLKEYNKHQRKENELTEEEFISLKETPELF